MLQSTTMLLRPSPAVRSSQLPSSATCRPVHVGMRTSCRPTRMMPCRASASNDTRDQQVFDEKIRSRLPRAEIDMHATIVPTEDEAAVQPLWQKIVKGLATSAAIGVLALSLVRPHFIYTLIVHITRYFCVDCVEHTDRPPPPPPPPPPSRPLAITPDFFIYI